MRVSEILSSISNLFLERYCIFCEVPGAFLCRDCEESVPFIKDHHCLVCGKPFPDLYIDTNFIKPHPCQDCLQHPPCYDLHRSLLSYEGVAKDLVHQLKYHGQFWVKRFYEQYLENLKNLFRDVDLIIPIPLHLKRLQKRGYNQSQILAEAWSQILNQPLKKNILLRTKNTVPQIHLDIEERQNNLKQAFAIYHAEEIEGKNILLVDDVHTTGATLNMASRELKKVGVKSVFATSLAIVPSETCF